MDQQVPGVAIVGIFTDLPSCSVALLKGSQVQVGEWKKGVYERLGPSETDNQIKVGYD